VTKPLETDGIVYKERVIPNIGTFVATFLLLPAIAVVSEPIDIGIGLVIGVVAVLGIWISLIVMAPVITVEEGILKVAKAQIPLKNLGEIQVISEDEIFEERGPRLHHLAFKVFQGTVKTGIKVSINDTNDPTPYWLFSTRKPEELAEALRNRT
jgi:hypothetical protein